MSPRGGLTPDAGRQPDPRGVRTVVCYLRTANPGTVGQQFLTRQRAKLEAEIAAHGWTVLAWVEDLHQSGTTLDRPSLQDVLALLAGHQADALLAADAAVVAVDPGVAAELAALATRQGWQLLTLSPSPTSTPASAAADGRHPASPGPRCGGSR